MVDLTTTYMGMTLKNPVVPSASPLSSSLDTIKRMEDAGAAAVVLHSLFEEQIEFEAEAWTTFLEHGTDSFAEALSLLSRRSTNTAASPTTMWSTSARPRRPWTSPSSPA